MAAVLVIPVHKSKTTIGITGMMPGQDHGDADGGETRSMLIMSVDAGTRMSLPQIMTPMKVMNKRLKEVLAMVSRRGSRRRHKHCELTMRS